MPDMNCPPNPVVDEYAAHIRNCNEEDPPPPEVVRFIDGLNSELSLDLMGHMTDRQLGAALISIAVVGQAAVDSRMFTGQGIVNMFAMLGERLYRQGF